MRALILVAIATLVAISCGQAHPGNATSVATVAASPSPFPPISESLSSCSLPVTNWAWQTNGSISSIASQNGFISMRSGTFTADPAGILVDDATTGRHRTQQVPVLFGDGGSTYDWSYRRWLPVARAQVLPDGSAYVYELQSQETGAYEIHKVNVATGTDTVISHMPDDNAYAPLAFEPEGVYVFPILRRSGLPRGLWLLDPTTQSLKAFPTSMDGTWQAVAAGGAWGGPGGTYGNSLARLDLSTGVVTTWFTHAIFVPEGMGKGYGVSLVGFDGSLRPLIQFYPPGDTTASPARIPGPEVWLVSAPDQATMLTGLTIPDQGLMRGVTDSHGTWFAGTDGVYLYTDSGFQRVAPWSTPPSSGYTIQGECD